MRTDRGREGAAMGDMAADIRRARELDAGATPGPWVFTGGPIPHEQVGPAGGPGVALVCPTATPGRGWLFGAKEVDNALFIAESRDLLPRLADYCDALRAELPRAGNAERLASDLNLARRRLAELEAELRGVLGDLMRFLAFPADAMARQALARRVAAGIGGDAADVLRKLAAVAAGKGGA